MTISKYLEIAHRRLTNAGVIDSAWLDAEVLLSFALQRSRPWLLAHHDQQINSVAIQQFNHLTMRRARGEPVAYLTGEREFCGLSFKVNQSALIPRPATEDLVESVTHYFKTEKLKTEKLVIDIGTGSGCIAVTLAKQFPNVKIIATDISRDALAVAQENAERHLVADRITFLHGNLLNPIINHVGNWKLEIGNSRLMVAANLPYVPSSVIAAKPELAHEPARALDGGPDGTEIYQQLFCQLINSITHKLIPLPVSLFFEMEPTILPALLALPEAKRLSRWYTIERQNHVLSLHKNLKRR